MSTLIKASERNVINFWFAEITPIQQYKIKMNPRLWVACQAVSQVFEAPSGILDQKQYRRADKVAFARMVLIRLSNKEIASDQVTLPISKPLNQYPGQKNPRTVINQTGNTI